MKLYGVDGRAFPADSRSAGSVSGDACSPGIAPNGRDLPWRKTSDPYHILVSEIMLQQTQVDRVLPKYHEWLDKYPSLAALAAAPKTRWPRRGGRSATTSGRAGCSRSRANRWRATAGELPSDDETLLSFKGIGAYTAGAIRSFAFGQRAAILDTNVARVLYRVFVGRGDIKAHTMRKRSVERLRSARAAQARLRLQSGADGFRRDVCTARKPKCDACPMTRSCTVVPAAVHEAVIVVVAAVIEEGGAFLVTRRQQGVHLAGLWEFPGGKIDDEETHARGAGPRDPRGARRGDRCRRAGLRGHACVSTTGPWRCTSIDARCGHAAAAARAGDAVGARADLAALGFPPADEELIKLLTGSGVR